MSSPAPHANPDYLASLGLQRAPFLDQIDDRFFYADPALVQRLDLLQHLIQFGDMLLGVVGPSGSGKSTLVRQLLLRGGTTWRGCRLSGAQIPQPANLFAQLADCFGLDRNAAPDRLRGDLTRISETLRHNGQTAIVVIDDAHLLPDAALRALLEIGGTARATLKLLRIVLFSEPGLVRRLTQAGWHSPVQPLLHSVDLPNLDDHQTAAYLMYRLAAAGYSGESPFSLTEIRALHKAAGGLPGRLNVLANEMLMEHAKRRTARPPGHTARKVRFPVLPIAAVTGLFFAGALGWYMHQAGKQGVAPTPSENEVPAPVAEQSAAPPAETGTGADTSPPAEFASKPALEDSRPLPPPGPGAEHGQPGSREPVAPDGGQANSAEPTPDAIPAGNPAAIPEGIRDTGKAGSAISTPTPAVGAKQIRDAAPVYSGSAASTTDPQETRHPAKPQGRPLGEPAPTASVPPSVPAADARTPSLEARGEPAPPKSAETPPVRPAADDPPVAPQLTDEQRDTPVTAAAAPGSKPSRPVIDLPPGIFDAGWLLARPSSHFTLQLIGVRSPASLRGYLRDHAIPAPVAYFRTRLKGGDWYVLVQGDYSSMAAARAAAALLPAPVRRDQPWPRSFTTIHADIRKVAP